MHHRLLLFVIMLSLWLTCSVTSQILQKASVSGGKINLVLLAGCITAYGLSVAVQYTAYLLGIPASTLVPLFNCNQIIIALYASWKLHESISGIKWLAILLVLTGCLLIGWGSKL